MTKFEWDADKADHNLRKHRVSFEEAETAILGELSKTAPDPDHSLIENRFITFGIFRREEGCWLFATLIVPNLFA